MNKRITRQKKVKAVSPNRFGQFLQTYPAVNLEGALSTFEGSLGWELMEAYMAYVQREFETDALDLIAKDEMGHRAAFASGYAKALEDMQDGFVEGIRQTLSGRSSVTEIARPEE